MAKNATLFYLRVDLGNADCQTYEDLAWQLRRLARDFDQDSAKVIQAGESGSSRDLNGNRVADWHTEG
jgi:hypothetical protein